LAEQKTGTRVRGRAFIALAIAASLIVGALIGWIMTEAFDDSDDSGTPDEPYLPSIDPDNFSNNVDNEFFPLIPGTTTIFEGDTDEGLERIEVTVLSETKVVMGVTCVVVRDTVSLDGEVTEDTLDWYAQDDEGNVWYMGEDSKEYKDGVVVSTAGSWEAGVDGALPGIVMLANPLVGVTYRQEYYEGEAEDMAQVVTLDANASVAYGEFQDLLMTSEWNPLEPGVVEHKYYAEGIGIVLEVMVEGGSERVELIQITN